MEKHIHYDDDVVRAFSDNKQRQRQATSSATTATTSDDENAINYLIAFG